MGGQNRLFLGLAVLVIIVKGVYPRLLSLLSLVSPIKDHQACLLMVFISSTTTVSPVRSSGAPLFYWSVAISSRKQPPATNKNTGKLAKSGVHLSAIYSNFVYDGWYLL